MFHKAIQTLQNAGIADATQEVRYILNHILGTYCHEKDLQLSEEKCVVFQQMIARRCQHEPLAKILGYKNFWKSTFVTTHDTLDPRPETETLIEAVLSSRHYPVIPAHAGQPSEFFLDPRIRGDDNLVILDLGTGTGCLLLSLLQEYPKAYGIGIDISEAALSVAQCNASRLGLAERCAWLQSDWCTALPTGLSVDIVVCNPPYIAETDPHLEPHVKQFEPALALFAHDNGLRAYADILSTIKPWIHSETLLFFEIGQEQHNDVCAIATQQGYRVQHVFKDLLGIPRVLCLFF